MFNGLKFFVLYEKGIGSLSPNSTTVLFMFIELSLNLGGVPVFNLPDFRPSFKEIL